MICPACGMDNIEGADRCENCLAPFRDIDIPTAEASQGLARSVMEDKLTELDYEDAICVGPEVSAIEVARLMKERNCGCALVVKDKRLIGIFTEHDVLLRMTGSVSVAGSSSSDLEQGHSFPVEQLPVTDVPLSDTPVEELRFEAQEYKESAAPANSLTKGWESIAISEVMTPNPEILFEHESVAYALNKMSIGRYRHVPIKRGDGSYSVASIKNVLNYIAREDW